MADKTVTYEAWIAPSAASIRVKVVTLKATSERAAFQEALMLCEEGEFVRGVMVVHPEGDTQVVPS